MSDKPSPKVIMVILAIVGLLCLWTGSTRFISAWNASNWPVVKGKVIESSIEKKWTPDGDIVTPHLSYEYKVEGIGYVSSQITLAQQSFFNDKWSEAIIKKYPAGSYVEVYYDPSSPFEAAIYNGITPVSYTQPIIGLFMLIAAAIIFVRQRKLKGINSNSRLKAV
ncbi:MAG: DUF3592 domain-containing protein [Deltaproteobacteria bacterium]|nr:DUF3592 domain-containing protein [Deltaproteobacteria bacterium]